MKQLLDDLEENKILELEKGSTRSHRTRCGGGYRHIARQTMKRISA